MYEQRTSAEIEQAYLTGKSKSIRLQISGFFYVIDLKDMFQYREDHPNRRRNIRRGAVGLDCVKGIAGILASLENAIVTDTQSGPDTQTDSDTQSCPDNEGGQEATDLNQDANGYDSPSKT